MSEEELSQNIKYPFRIGVEKIEYFNEDIRQEFLNDFDEVYNVFLVELGDLMFKWGVRKLDTYVGYSQLLQRDSSI